MQAVLLRLLIQQIRRAEEKGADAADTEAGEAAEGVMPAVAKEDLKVGVIHIGNPVVQLQLYA